jgi:hypothetical protein
MQTNMDRYAAARRNVLLLGALAETSKKKTGRPKAAQDSSTPGAHRQLLVYPHHTYYMTWSCPASQCNDSMLRYAGDCTCTTLSRVFL